MPGRRGRGAARHTRGDSGRGFTRVVAAGAVSLLLAACGSLQAPDPPAGGEPQAHLLPVPGFPSCAGAEELIAAPDDWYAEEPVYVGNADHLVPDLHAWAAAQPGFEELWFDRDRNGWLTLGFTAGDVEALQAQVRAEFPGEGIVVVAVPHTQRELLDLQDEVAEALHGMDLGYWGIDASTARGWVSLELSALTADVEAALEPFAGRPLCADVMPPVDAVPDGDQPAAGPGWRLLGEGLTGESYRTGVATTPDQLAGLWLMAGLEGEPPAMDFATEIAIWFGAVYGSSCPIRMDHVLVVGEVVHGDFVVPGSPMACTGDANPHAYVVALERDRLPAGPFMVQLRADDPPPGVPEERTVVDVDLSAPGATATDEQIHPDQALLDRADQPQGVRAGEWLEVGWPNTVELVADGTCLADWVGEFNQVVWVPDQPGAQVSETWREAADANGGVLHVEGLMTESPTTFTLEFGGESVELRPARSSDPSGC